MFFFVFFFSPLKKKINIIKNKKGPAAAVIPAPIAYINVVAVKKLVVGFWAYSVGRTARCVVLGWGFFKGGFRVLFGGFLSPLIGFAYQSLTRGPSPFVLFFPSFRGRERRCRGGWHSNLWVV